MQPNHIDWGQWAVVGPLLNTFVIALVCYVLTYLKCRVEELQKAVEQRALALTTDRRQDGLKPPAGNKERRGPEPGRRQVDKLRARWQQPPSSQPSATAASSAQTKETNREQDNEPSHESEN